MGGATPAQTVGPYFSLGLAERPFCTPPTSPSIRLKGCVLDAAGTPVPDAMLEVWMRGDGPNVFFRVTVAADGRFDFACWDGTDDTRPVRIQVMARGVLETLTTVVWRAEAVPAPDSSLWLGIPHARRHTVMARRAGDDYAWDIRLSGGEDAGETIFLDPAD